MATAEQITAANKTSRNSPAIGQKALTPKVARSFMVSNLKKDDSLILDFGAGKSAAHAQQFVSEGWQVLAHEFGDNINPRVHCELAMTNKYDLVYASNVLNVQGNEAMLRETLAHIKHVMKDGAVFIANYPLNPRKSDLTTQEVRAILAEEFNFVTWTDGKKAAPVWWMEK